ncbi:DHH/RecJ family phosphoesterase [Natrialba magadii ATCC 43099]|uniref:DHH/RecJ family phosphoesterase n=1 Tax=Natrialba magadii (strain ATCC 43099 / DSM 3394 / CCM 3739 / CIP 104546 / IAM 13178 / JCM 8861 / NBRC 102185 / NCIMB 2190 / MS3) TaxID=547559 RepID=D3SYY5_NATMM|nr:DHH family phosphoesterase [Natrialba magadii]ADD06177.1 DHH/RecJ family phosphoesterase [Natrialba magadii ATCC 43099]ELY30824.1 phosphoesterase RecJ domain-containing protein [Natrialba magadii ATCC 43099]
MDVQDASTKMGAVEAATERPVAAMESAVDSLGALDPLVLSLLILALVGLALGSWWLVRWFRRPPGVRLQRVLADYDDVTVLMHPNPDPDAMACALGVSAIAHDVGTETTLQYPGEIRHQENRAFRTVLGLDLEQIASSSELASDAVVLVDHNTARGFTGAQTVEPVAVVDHHPGNGTGTKFTDVRTDYGAASTIVVEYLEELGAVSEADDEDGLTLAAELATGLLYGIQSDTDHLTNGCSRAEFDACAYLFSEIDEDLLERIANPQVSDDVLQIKATAITEKRIEGPFAICDVGTISNTDAIPQAADELMHLEGVTAVVVYGESDGTIHLSGRSRDDRVHMGETLRHAVNDIPMANAGGHARMGGGQISVDHMRGLGPSDGVDKAEFEERLFAALSGER